MRPLSGLGKLLGRLSPALLLAVLASALLSGTVLAADHPVVSGQVYTTTQGATQCDSSTNEILYVLNGIVGTAPASISVTFSGGSTVTFPQTFINKPGTTAHYSITINANNASLTNQTIVSASFVAPVGMTSYGEFVLSHFACPTPSTTTSTTGTTGTPGGTPELDSILLFASGLTGLGGYIALRRRARRS